VAAPQDEEISRLQRDQHPAEDGRKCLVEGVRDPQRIVGTGGLDDAERRSRQNAEKTMLMNCAPDSAAKILDGTMPN
jgi:hypothetical protein